MATAGDYRRFFESGGRHYSHIIDPRTGFPVTHDTVSATAMAADCMQADALATVLMVMPPAEALALADRTGLRALLIGHAETEIPRATQRQLAPKLSCRRALARGAELRRQARRLVRPRPAAKSRM